MISVTDETGRLSSGELGRLEELLGLYADAAGAGTLPELPEGMPRFSLVLTDDLGIAALNARDRGVPEPTDVLSYPANEPDDSGFPVLPFLGDVFVSLDTATRQAEEAGHSPETEVLLLAAHGFTHLRGYDHQTEDEWEIFRKEQARMLALVERTGTA